MKKEPFFARQGDAFIPNPISNGPWNADSMHGRVVISLLAHAIEDADFANLDPADFIAEWKQFIHTIVDMLVKESLIERDDASLQDYLKNLP